METPSLKHPCGLTGLVLLSLGVFSCGRGLAPLPPAPHRGPIVLITFDALRADAVHALGGAGTVGESLTPNLDAFLAEADWAGRAAATS